MKQKPNGKIKYFIFTGPIPDIRDIEDCIRASKKYSEGIARPKGPTQGSNFPSRKLHKYYEVYPDMEVGMGMPLGDAIDLLWGDTPSVNVEFNYDYRDKSGMASVLIDGGSTALINLVAGIPALGDLLMARPVLNGHKDTVTVLISKARIQAQDKDRAIRDAVATESSWWVDRILDKITPRSHR